MDIVDQKLRDDGLTMEIHRDMAEAPEDIQIDNVDELGVFFYTSYDNRRIPSIDMQSEEQTKDELLQECLQATGDAKCNMVLIKDKQHDNRLIGGMCYTADAGSQEIPRVNVLLVAVAKEYRRKGIFHAMMSAVMSVEMLDWPQGLADLVYTVHLGVSNHTEWLLAHSRMFKSDIVDIGGRKCEVTMVLRHRDLYMHYTFNAPEAGPADDGAAAMDVDEPVLVDDSD
jgi:GNAT superfamily N-acetyltransferase